RTNDDSPIPYKGFIRLFMGCSVVWGEVDMYTEAKHCQCSIDKATDNQLCTANGHYYCLRDRHHFDPDSV
ncbi:hypothetical protein J6590_039333, partial [Homalodisca vitripennis]